MSRKPRRSRENKRAIEPLTETEVRSLLRACTDTPTGRRNAALVAVLYFAGLRLSEALALRVKDLDTKAKTLRVLNGKNDEHRTVALTNEAMRYLERWIYWRKDYANGKHVLFCTISRGKATGFGEGKKAEAGSAATTRLCAQRAPTAGAACRH